MEDYIQAVFAAWDVVKEKLVRDAGELAVRLARRRRAAVQRPPRAVGESLLALLRIALQPLIAGLPTDAMTPAQLTDSLSLGTRELHKLLFQSHYIGGLQ